MFTLPESVVFTKWSTLPCLTWMIGPISSDRLQVAALTGEKTGVSVLPDYPVLTHFPLEINSVK